MKTVRQFLVFPLEVVMMVITAIIVPLELLGCAVGYLCQLIEGPQ